MPATVSKVAAWSQVARSPLATPIVIVRVYITESRAHVARILKLLRKSDRLRGATVFRGIAGFGTSTPEEADAAAPTDPPLVIEFFDTEQAVNDTIKFIKSMIEPHHIVTIRAESR